MDPSVAADTVGVDAIVDGRDVVLPVTLATCDAGVRECDNRKFLKTLATHQKLVDAAGPNLGLDAPPAPTCANYDGRYEEPGRLSWVLGLSAGFGALMTYGIGANDAANSWGTSVGLWRGFRDVRRAPRRCLRMARRRRPRLRREQDYQGDE